METTRRELKSIAEQVFRAGIAAVDPALCIKKNLCLSRDELTVCNSSFRLETIDRIFLVGLGKAACAMALAAEEILGDRIHNGIVITKYGHGLDLSRSRVIEAGHPIPDANGLKGGDLILDLVSEARKGDLILCLVSGGGSALVPAPVSGISLEDKQETTRLLMTCGATIQEINTIRKHLSRIKGGQLCRHTGHARVVSLVLSDVVGDDLDMIASGMTVPDSTSFMDCDRILKQYRLRDRLPHPVTGHFKDGFEGRAAETPKPGDPLFELVDNFITGSLSQALEAAATEARTLGFTPLILTSTLQGEAAEVAKVLSAVAREAVNNGHPLPAPACILSGGETTVTLKGKGKGGRNMELALAAAIELDGLDGVMLLSAGTDGTDGPTDATGAFASGTTLARARALDLDAQSFLDQNDSYHFFFSLKDLCITGPTRTNVMDLQLILIS